MNSLKTPEPQSHSSRRRARVTALKALYEIDISKHDPQAVLGNHLANSGLSSSSKQYAARLVEGFLENSKEIDSTISLHAPAWPFPQIPMVDRNVLRIGTLEIEKLKDIPPKVAINESVEMSKVFGSDKSPKFVNGVLGSVLKEKLRKKQ